MFHAAIDENYPFFSGTVCNDFFAAYTSDLIDEIGIDKINFVFILKNDFSFHATLFPEQFGQFARIDTRDARYFFFFQPFAEAFHGIPMTVIFGVIRYDDGFGMDFLRFEKG